MFKHYIKHFFSFFIPFAIILFFIAAAYNWSAEVIIIFYGALFIIAAYFSGISTGEEFLKEYKAQLEQSNKKLQEETKLRIQFHKDAEIWKASLLEKTSGFPSLHSSIQEYEKLKDDYLANYLINKQYPALKASEIIKLEAQKRRKAEFENKNTQAIIDYYELIAPFLVDLKNDIVDLDSDLFSEYSEEEKQDAVVNYLSKEEYRKLPPVERNQMALDRFWKRPKSNWLLGRLYERYIGYLYEMQGYNVDYIGIFKGYEDLGRDLICNKGNKIIVIQCKNWSQFKTIYEKHIFQFFGTVFQYRDSNHNNKVDSIFYTTTQVSDLARRFAKELGIELKENFKFDQNYPCIKCNVNKATKEKIYHLPFDQQYDNTKIFEKGEFYCCTAKEAEDKGFRRAFRWHGQENKS